MTHNNQILNILTLMVEAFLQMEAKMTDLSALTAAVDENTNAVNAAIVVIQNLGAEIEALKGGGVDQGVIDALTAKISAAVAALKAA